MQDGGFGRGAGQVGEEAVACQHGGVDAVVLGEPAMASAKRRERSGLTATFRDLNNWCSSQPGGLKAARVTPRPASCAERGGRLGVGEVALGRPFEIGVESGLANIDAGDYSWGGNGHCCVVFLSRASRHSCVCPFAVTHASVEGVQELLRRADQARTRLERPRRKTVRPVGAVRRPGQAPGAH